MDAAVDPFHPILRVLERYRADVHHLRPGVPGGTADAVQEHLGREIPASLRAFLLRWNGATLFRGALRVRGAADLAPPDANHPDVILFADGPRDDDRWGFAETAFGHHFGRWDGQRLVPQHEHFSRWLLAQTRILDENVREPDDELRIRMEVDPACGLLWFQHGEALLARGDADGATAAFRRASALHPDHPCAWQRLGEALLGDDEPGARGALVMGWRATRFPLPYAGAPAPTVDIVSLMESRFPPGDPGFERELVTFLEERVTDVKHAAGSEAVTAALLALVRCRLHNGDRAGARDAVYGLRDRAAGWAYPPDLAPALLALAGLEADLGNHDEAEDVIRRLRRHPDPAVRARSELVLARIALLREEPWVDDIVRGALPGLRDAAERCEAFLLLAEYARGTDHASVNEAARLAAQCDRPSLTARVQLARGDAAVAAGDRAGALAAYAACEADPEAALRARVRTGDLFDDPAQAITHYVAAVEGYQRLGLPLREAWARLRLVRCGDPAQAHEAAAIFRACGLAAGVAACDAALDRLGHALDWHLHLAADAARQRHDAQRQRPPHQRADADRPERRLLSHRRAIAACDDGIVTALASDIGTELQRIHDADGRARDPMVMRFVAGIDLLAGHPSWAAAKVLLGILAEDVRQPVAERAVVGALIRSPNMTLVDALVRALEGGTEPTRLATIIEVLGWRREVLAVPKLRDYARDGSLPVRRAAITALGRVGDEESVDLIDEAMAEPELAEVASTALLLLGNFRGVDFFAQALARDERWLTQSPGEIVGRYGGTSYRFLLTRTASQPGAAGLGALAGLGLMGSVHAVPTLIEHVDGRDTQRQAVAATALECITGHREDTDDAHVKQRWLAWWAEHEPDFTAGVRYRDGRPLTVRALVERLGHDDFAVRQAAYDELRVATGERLAFDADGPWRVQLSHRAAWERWWADHAHALPATGWMFHGEALP